ncbi:CDP-alcohol phosphatidyltransferase family protein [Arthrobacter gandavensis]|uniref:CDP-alcohol phosphatidyltransferase family protein n=1 Tax=Arthrobacter gandavensis TaxID=169960 RepID=UPI001E57E386|nr:CDP-alcohol phosphatidyltransferase family protein [Arthrobacter gandavensis]
MSPNQVTALSALSTFSGIGMIVAVQPTFLSSLTVSLLLILGYALDSADGQLSRLTGRGSMAGEWLDHTVDAFKVGSIHLTFLVCWWRFYDLEAKWLLLPLLFQVLATVHFFSGLLMDQLRRSLRAAGKAPGDGNRSSSLLYSLAVLPTDFGIICVLSLLLFVPWLFAGLYMFLLACTAAFLVLALGKWYREVKSWN